MPQSHKRRVDALESRYSTGKTAAEYSDRKLLDIAVPSYTGPMPDEDELMVLLAQHFPATAGLEHGDA